MQKQSINDNGIYSYSLLLNSQKQPVKLINFNSKGVISEDVNGIASYSWSLNEKGWIISENIWTAIIILSSINKVFLKKCYWEENVDSYIIRYEYYNKDGNLTKKKDGVSINILRFDKNRKSARNKIIMKKISLLAKKGMLLLILVTINMGIRYNNVFWIRIII